MMKNLLFLFLLLPTFASAQLSNRFYSNGNPSNIANLGAYGANTYLQWRQIQPTPGAAYDWSFSDLLVQAYQTAGLNLMITLSCTHPVNTDDVTPGTCAYIFNNGSGDNNANWPVTGVDTTEWIQFVNALVDRYDNDGLNDMPGLSYPVTQWHIIGQEWHRVWCDFPNIDTSFQYAKDFVKLVNMTYNVVKTKQPQSTVSYAGIDIRFQAEAFYDGYLPISQTTICNSVSNCSTQLNSTAAQLAISPKFLPSRRNVMYIFKNALADEVDLHQYGRWKNIPEFVLWAKDSTFGKPIIFMEGGGPFCPACEDTYHSPIDTDGRLPASLVRDNASYVVYYYVTGLANNVKKLHWNLPNEYAVWGATWGDLDLLSINNIRKPSFYTYRFLAQSIFSTVNADTVVKVNESNPDLYHYQIEPMNLHVAWSTNAIDSIVVNGVGELFRWDIPIACNSLYPTSCDSTIQESSVTVNGDHTIHLNDGVPVFYSWNNVISMENNISDINNYNIKIFPNPFDIQTTLWTDRNLINATITIDNIFGQTVKHIENISENSFVIPRDGLPSGIYFIRLIENSKVITVKKLIIVD